MTRGKDIREFIICVISFLERLYPNPFARDSKYDPAIIELNGLLSVQFYNCGKWRFLYDEAKLHHTKIAKLRESNEFAFLATKNPFIINDWVSALAR